MSRGGELNQGGKLRKYIGFYTTGRNLYEREKYESGAEIRDEFVIVSEIGLTAKQIRIPIVIM